MANIGSFNSLTVIDLIEHGAILDGEELGEVLLPNRYVPENLQLEDQISVFLYNDSLDRLVATTQTPKAQIGDFASLKVVAVNKIGAFLDWGLPKDLLVPFNQQHKKMELGKHYFVRLYLDEKTSRIVATSKIDKFVDIWPAEYQQGQEVDLTIATRTDLGFKAIINKQHWGLIFQSDIFQAIRTGLNIKGFIKDIRADGKITLSLQRTGKGKVTDFSGNLLAYLEQHQGFAPFNDKSSPTEIQKTFGVSKKAFKQTTGRLLKLGKIAFVDNGIALINVKK